METKSRYLSSFKRIKTSNLKGTYMLVEMLAEPEIKTAGGIMLPNKTATQLGTAYDAMPCFCVVLETGPGYSDDNGVVIPNSMEAKVGNVILIPKMSVRLYSAMPGFLEYVQDTIGITREDEVQMLFRDVNEFNKYFQKLNIKVIS